MSKSRMGSLGDQQSNANMISVSQVGGGDYDDGTAASRENVCSVSNYGKKKMHQRKLNLQN